MVAMLALLCCLGAATVGGTFYGFSTFIMQALAVLPASRGVAAMQSINVVVLESQFVVVFIGTAALSAACIVVSLFDWNAPGSAWLLAAGTTYVVGSVLVTVAFNIPKNERLEPMDADSAEAAAYWPLYLRQWTFWNHVRTAASLTSAACAFAAAIA